MSRYSIIQTCYNLFIVAITIKQTKLSAKACSNRQLTATRSFWLKLRLSLRSFGPYSIGSSQKRTGVFEERERQLLMNMRYIDFFIAYESKGFHNFPINWKTTSIFAVSCFNTNQKTVQILFLVGRKYTAVYTQIRLLCTVFLPVIYRASSYCC